MAASPEEIRRHIKTHWMVALVVCIFMAVTVALAVVPAFDLGAPGTTAADIVLALAIAVFQSSLVILIFMHLKQERGLIYKMLLFTLAFAAGLMALTLIAQSNQVRWDSLGTEEAVSPVKDGGGV